MTPPKFVDYLYILATVVFTLLSQVLVKWQVSENTKFPETVLGKLTWVFNLLQNPYILLSIFSTLLAGISWMIALSKFELSYAYPWSALSFVFMLGLGILLFGESLNVTKVVGSMLVLLGLITLSRG